MTQEELVQKLLDMVTGLSATVTLLMQRIEAIEKSDTNNRVHFQYVEESQEDEQ